MSSAINENQTISNLLKLLGEVGYQQKGFSSLDEGINENTFMLTDRFISSLMKLNTNLDEVSANKVKKEIQNFSDDNLMSQNQKLHDFLINGFFLEREVKITNIKLVDFNNVSQNDFLAVTDVKMQNKVIDVILYVNGLPLVIIECSKSLEGSINNLLKYQSSNPAAYYFNQLLIVTNGEEVRYSVIGENKEAFTEWKVQDSGTVVASDEKIVGLIFQPQFLLDIILNYIYFRSANGNFIKFVARYHHINAVNKVIEKVKNSHNNNRLGIVNHAYNTGKTMLTNFLVNKLINIVAKNDKILIVSNRLQTSDVHYQNLTLVDRYHVQMPGNNKELQSMLQDDGDSIIITNIQKFQGLSNESHDNQNIFVIADEFYNSNIFNVLPNARYIGITSAIENVVKKMTSVFGGVVDTYPLSEAVSDGFVLPISYEARLHNCHIQGIDTVLNESKKVQSHFRMNPERISEIVKDIISYTKENLQPFGYKSVLLVPNSVIAVNYEKLFRERNFEVSLFTAENHHRNYDLDNFIDREKNISLLISSDIPDSSIIPPWVQTVFVDKKLTENKLSKLSATVNKKYSGKSNGIIVDYYGMEEIIKRDLY